MGLFFYHNGKLSPLNQWAKDVYKRQAYTRFNIPYADLRSYMNPEVNLAKEILSTALSLYNWFADFISPFTALLLSLIHISSSNRLIKLFICLSDR